MTSTIDGTVRASALTRPAPTGGRARGVQPSLVLAVVAAGATATVLLWWHNTASIHGVGDWLTNAGRITGLLAGYGVIMLVALMARLPPLERGVGADRLARWHAMGGRYTVGLVAAHAVLITWGYAVTAHTNVVSQTKTFLLSYPDVLMATVGGLLLLGVGLVSMRAARTRMRYETWYYLHFYTYLAVALAFSHQFADGAQFMDNLAARLVWGGTYAAVGAAILWYRFATPTLQAFDHRLRVDSVRRRRRTSSASSSLAGTWTSCKRNPGSSSGGVSSPEECGGWPPRIRCQLAPRPTGCVSPSRRSATTAG